jgi:hypothetical protein
MDNGRAHLRSDIDSRIERDRGRRSDGREPANGDRATARFREMAGLDSAGSIQAIPTRA